MTLELFVSFLLMVFFVCLPFLRGARKRTLLKDVSKEQNFSQVNSSSVLKKREVIKKESFVESSPFFEGELYSIASVKKENQETSRRLNLKKAFLWKEILKKPKAFDL